MSFERSALAAAIAAHGRIARVVIASVKGSAPRGAGTAMLVWETGASGTIGGGALEFEAIAEARAALHDGRDRLARKALGPGLGQCCGGAVSLLTEIWDAARLSALTGPVLARPLPGGPAQMPLGVRRLVTEARGQLPGPGLREGWMIEPVSSPERQLWIYGAGHVGRAVVDVLAPLPQIAITWIDTGSERFPQLDAPITRRIADHPASQVGHAPRDAEHLILTYSHAFDLDLCHALLGHGFGWAGLIGSASKWARFRSRLAALGHPPDRIARITCPIGDPALGKHPQAIAIGVAAALLAPAAARRKARTA